MAEGHNKYVRFVVVHGLVQNLNVHIAYLLGHHHTRLRVACFFFLRPFKWEEKPSPECLHIMELDTFASQCKSQKASIFYVQTS